jgi:sulfide:quinone oxidoreductase
MTSLQARGQRRRVVVLGAGFGAWAVTTLLAERLGDQVAVTLVDKSDGFTFGFSKLDVMFGRTSPERVLHRYRDIAAPGVEIVRAEVRAIDLTRKRVSTDAGDLDADVLVLARGAELHP